ncbi:MAG TPA: hypothetical protein VGR87_11065 [Candidatus Limnocylindria bacterium]|jgi:hypothetical protein|nr:hypothetical protein [Candidatus Limnocylindria bacterium]
MEGTGTMLAPAAGRKDGQLVAGRYRLASLHRTDDKSEVWRALDQSTQRVVTLEFLRSRDGADRERFVADARRMAAFQQPAVVRVAAIHDDEDATFIVFEDVAAHALPGPGNQEQKVQGPAPIAGSPDPLAVKKIKIGLNEVAPPEPVLEPAAAPEPPSAPEGASESPYEHGLEGLRTVWRARDLALFERSMLKEAAIELLAMARVWLAEQDFETRLRTLIAQARTRAENVDRSGLNAAIASAADSARGLAKQPRVSLPALPRLRVPSPKVSLPRVSPPHVALPSRPRVARAKPAAVPKVAKPHVARTPMFGRVRWRRAFWRGLSLGLIAAVIIVLPAEFVASVGGTLRSAFDQGVQTASTIIEERVKAVTSPTPSLAPATFELPPLSAYKASFESQAAYPTARPNGTVEWVVALRNSGSVGWYRGIDGAQASLTLSDGSSVAVQSTPYVGPGQVGWFVVHFPAPAQPGTYTIPLLPRIDGRGSLPDLGIYAVVTVAAN